MHSTSVLPRAASAAAKRTELAFLPSARTPGRPPLDCRRAFSTRPARASLRWRSVRTVRSFVRFVRSALVCGSRVCKSPVSAGCGKVATARHYWLRRMRERRPVPAKSTLVARSVRYSGLHTCARHTLHVHALFVRKLYFNQSSSVGSPSCTHQPQSRRAHSTAQRHCLTLAMASAVRGRSFFGTRAGGAGRFIDGRRRRGARGVLRRRRSAATSPSAWQSDCVQLLLCGGANHARWQ